MGIAAVVVAVVLVAVAVVGVMSQLHVEVGCIMEGGGVVGFVGGPGDVCVFPGFAYTLISLANQYFVFCPCPPFAAVQGGCRELHGIWRPAHRI